MVLRSGEPITLEVRLPIEFVNDALSWQLKLEQGGLLSGQLTPSTASWSVWPNSKRWSARPIAWLWLCSPSWVITI